MNNFGEGKEYPIYTDIQKRTKGEIYIGVVGPVRTGKSTFIRRFLEQLILPNIVDEDERVRAQDEMPQAAQGKTIMTTEPKFIPQDAVSVCLDGENAVKVRLIDCVGFLIDGVNGHMEGNQQRMVKTPWSAYEIPFSQAAEIGTQKVICDHSTIAVAISTDGSIGELDREHYIQAENRTIEELKKYGKPFVLVLNSRKPYSDDTIALAQELSRKYETFVIPANCEQLKREDIYRILSSILQEFQITRVDFMIPRWVEMLPAENIWKQRIVKVAAEILEHLLYAKDVREQNWETEEEMIDEIKAEEMDLATGKVTIRMKVKESYYYQNISELAGVHIASEYQLIEVVRQFAKMKEEYDQVKDALEAVKVKGYGVINPKLADVSMDDPVMIRHGNKFGVKLKAVSPSIHMIRANIETEIAPIVGNEEQARDLIDYISKSRKQEEGVWNTSIFGKSIGELVEDGIRSKITMMDDECQMKLQDTMQKIVNDNNGGMVCIII